MVKSNGAKRRSNPRVNSIDTSGLTFLVDSAGLPLQESGPLPIPTVEFTSMVWVQGNFKVLEFLPTIE